MREEAKIGRRYLNKNTGKIHTVLHNALAAWDMYQSFVVYRGENTDAKNQIWIRELAEFNENFELLD
jgi:hypothetical protein